MKYLITIFFTALIAFYTQPALAESPLLGTWRSEYGRAIIKKDKGKLHAKLETHNHSHTCEIEGELKTVSNEKAYIEKKHYKVRLDFSLRHKNVLETYVTKGNSRPYCGMRANLETVLFHQRMPEIYKSSLSMKDCLARSTKSIHTLCTNQDLARIDQNLMLLFDKLKIKDKADWINMRETCNASDNVYECLLDAYADYANILTKKYMKNHGLEWQRNVAYQYSFLKHVFDQEDPFISLIFYAPIYRYLSKFLSSEEMRYIMHNYSALEFGNKKQPYIFIYGFLHGFYPYQSVTFFIDKNHVWYMPLKEGFEVYAPTNTTEKNLPKPMADKIKEINRILEFDPVSISSYTPIFPPQGYTIWQKIKDIF